MGPPSPVSMETKLPFPGPMTHPLPKAVTEAPTAHHPTIPALTVQISAPCSETVQKQKFKGTGRHNRFKFRACVSCQPLSAGQQVKGQVTTRLLPPTIESGEGQRETHSTKVHHNICVLVIKRMLVRMDFPICSIFGLNRQVIVLYLGCV